jgi:hypothetical protein
MTRERLLRSQAGWIPPTDFNALAPRSPLRELSSRPLQQSRVRRPKSLVYLGNEHCQRADRLRRLGATAREFRTTADAEMD